MAERTSCGDTSQTEPLTNTPSGLRSVQDVSVPSSTKRKSEERISSTLSIFAGRFSEGVQVLQPQRTGVFKHHLLHTDMQKTFSQAVLQQGASPKMDKVEISTYPNNPRGFSSAPAGATPDGVFSPGLTPRAKLLRPCRG